MSTLIIVESPAKAKKIQSYLGKDYIVLSSYGHICNLDIKKGIDAVEVKNNFKLNFSNLSDKTKIISQLKNAHKKVKEVIIATDEDREGEAIGYHLMRLLKLDIENTKRIVFNEITKKAIIRAIKNPDKLRMNFVNAQFGRMALDHIVGFHISPLLWKNINGPRGLSAGRVQSLVVKIIIDREIKIEDFTEKEFYKISGEFYNKSNKIIKAFIKEDLDDFMRILKLSIGQIFYIDNIQNKKGERKSPPPYTTSSLQQDISSHCGISTKQVMNIAQKLYEEGHITYHRTDSVNLSKEFLVNCKEYVIQKYGVKYSNIKNFKNNSSNAQEAHEAIRPTKIETTSLKNNDIKNRVYTLIWKRAVASQMSNHIINNILISIITNKYKEKFISNVEETIFDGFKILYNHKDDKELISLFKKLKVGDDLNYKIIRAEQTFTNTKDRYTESSLVKDLERKGIGRPSTYASMIEKVQDRKYILKTDIKGKKRKITNYFIDEKKLYEEKKEIEEPIKKNRLISTKLGREINKFLIDNFGDKNNNSLMNYNFTADLETHLDLVLDGDVNWKDILKNFYKDFFPIYNKLNMSSSKNSDTSFDKGRLVGNHPENGKPIYVRIGKYGPLAQIGEGSKTVKPKYINLKDCDLDTITLEEILQKGKYPKIIGKYKGDDIFLLESKYGFCIKWNGGFYSLYDNEKEDLDSIDEEKGIEVIERKKNKSKKPLKVLMDGRAMVLEGPYGIYIRYVSREGDGKNFKIPKNLSVDDIDDDLIKKLIK